MPLTAPSNRKRDRAESSSPKRRESSTAIGRAPTAKTSRRMPPTPVAAPWNGSTALGWLCDSTLNAQASPPPTSTAPAFSPGPMTTRSPSVGSRPSSLRECLYAQCSLHSSENIASSTALGSRSSFSQISSYSASVSPSSRCRLMAVSDGNGGRQGLEQPQSVGRARQPVDGVLGMGHEAEHIAGLVGHGCDVLLEAVADTQYRAALAGELEPRLHQRGEARDRAGSQVVAVGEPARHDHGVDALEVPVAVPQQDGLADARGRELRVDLVAGAGKADDAELHAPAPFVPARS